MAYTPPDSKNINFVAASGYTPPDNESIDFVMGGATTYTAKSVILDIADNWAGTDLGLRSVDFWFEGSKITILPTTDFVAYETSFVSASYVGKNVFDTSLSKVDTSVGTSWSAENNVVINQRLICVFNSEIIFDEIRVNNYHNSGGHGGRGSKNVKINTSSDSITDTTYDAAISNSTLIYDGTFDEHSAVNAEDEQTLTLIGIGPSTGLQDMKMDIASFGTITENLKLDLAAYFQSMSDMKMDIGTIGDISEDIKIDIEVYLYARDNIKLDISTGLETLEDLSTDIHVIGWGRKHNKLDLYTVLQTAESFSLGIQTAKELKKDTFLDMAITDGYIAQDSNLDILLSDGIKINDIGIDVSVIRNIPIFKTVYAMHLNSAIKVVS